MSFIPIIHKVNTIEKLKTVPQNYGVEIDIRFENNNLYLSHDLIADKASKCSLESFLLEYNHEFIVANIKDTGIESDVIQAISQTTNNFFLLDFEIPFLFHKNKKIKKYLSTRYSIFEQTSKESEVINYVDWIWVDTFSDFPINEININNLPNLKKCLVSPERWGREGDISKIVKFMHKHKINFELIMTDLNMVDIWSKMLNKEVS